MKLKKTTKKDDITLLQSLAINNPHFSKHKTDSNITNNIDNNNNNNSNSNNISNITNEIPITDQKRYPYHSNDHSNDHSNNHSIIYSKQLDQKKKREAARVKKRAEIGKNPMGYLKTLS